MIGANWWWGVAPQAVMAPDRGADAGWDVDAFVQHHILTCKFSAVHRPLQMLMPTAFDRRLCELADQHDFLVIPWVYGDVDGGTAPEDALGFQHNKEHQAAVVEFYRPYRNVMLGIGYDCGEWVADNEGNRWVARCKAQHPERWYAIRARLDEPRRDPDDGSKQRLGYRPGDVASFEVRLTDPYSTDDMVAAAFSPVFPGRPHVDRPIINEERFRVGDREKDTSYEAIPSIIMEYRAANIGAVFGVRDAPANWRWPAEVVPEIIAANGGAPPPQPPPDEDGDMKILDLGSLITVTVSAHPGPDESTKWTQRNHWRTADKDAEVEWVNSQPYGLVVYGLEYFLGFEASKIDEQSATPVICKIPGKSCHQLPSHVAEKDHPTSGFEASRVVMLPVGVRVPPGGAFVGQFHHTNCGVDPGQTIAGSNAPHGSITFFCYQES